MQRSAVTVAGWGKKKKTKKTRAKVLRPKQTWNGQEIEKEKCSKGGGLVSKQIQGISRTQMI